MYFKDVVITLPYKVPTMFDLTLGFNSNFKVLNTQRFIAGTDF